MKRRITPEGNEQKKGPKFLLKLEQSMRMRLKVVIIAASVLTIFAVVGGIIYFQLANVKHAHAATNGDYQTRGTGNWNGTTTWQKYVAGAWTNVSTSPTSADGVITILSGHTITITANVTVDQVMVNAGGQVVINDGVTLILNAGTGTDLDVYGTLQEIGTGATGASITINAGASIIFETTGIYQHNFSSISTQGAIPIATWNDGSTCEIKGFTSGALLHAANMNQSFSNFTWNCANQTTGYGLQGLLTNVRGNFTMQNSGATPQIVYGLGASAGGLTMSIGGDMIILGGIFDFANSGASGTFTLNIAGNYNQTGGTFQHDYTGGLAVHFTGSGKTFIQSAGTLSTTNMNFFVDNGASITLNNNIPVSTSLTVSNGGTLSFGTYIASGAGTFMLSSGGTLDMGSTKGITSSGANGNVQVTGARSFSAGGNYTYDGVAAQVTGNGLPATVNNLTISNSTGVTLTGTVSVSNILALTSGILTTGANQINVTNTAIGAITNYSNSNYVAGNLDRSVSGTGSYDFPIGTAAYYELINTNLASVTGFANILAEFTNANPINPSFPLTGLTVNGIPITSMLNYGYWTLTPNSGITGGTYTVTLNEQGQSNSATTAAAYTVLQRTNTTSSWQTPGTHINSTQSVNGGVVTAVRSALTTITQYGIGYGAGALPIELLYFKAAYNTNQVDLSWATASEQNNNFFTVERSSNGTDFSGILIKPGAGNSTMTLTYSATDESPLPGVSYYRLKQTDYNGKSSYSSVQPVGLSTETVNKAVVIQKIGPNPFTHNFSLNYNTAEEGAVEIQISNTSGQTVYMETINADQGFNTYSFTDNNNLPRGIYFVNITCNGQVATHKLIKQ